MSGPVVVLDNIRSCANVGSVLRTATAFGYTRAVMLGVTPTPDRKEVMKSALGGEQLPWTHFNRLTSNPDWPRPILVLETGGDDIFAAKVMTTTQNNFTLIIGSERGGVSKDLLQLADHRLSIKHHDEIIHSLNVASAFAIAAAVLDSKGG